MHHKCVFICVSTTVVFNVQIVWGIFKHNSKLFFIAFWFYAILKGLPHSRIIFFLTFFFFFFFQKFILLFIYDCVESSFLCEGFLQLRQVGTTPHRSARASHHRGLSCCGAQAPDAQAQQLWPTGPAAPRHMGSSQTRARTHVPCIVRQTLNHCATREAQCK